jgi:hypothetical protein
VSNIDPRKQQKYTQVLSKEKQLSRNIQMEERIGFLSSEEHEFLGVQVNSSYNFKRLK